MENGLRTERCQTFAQLIQSLPAVLAIDLKASLKTPPQGLKPLLQEPNHRCGGLFGQTGPVVLNPLLQTLQAGPGHAVQSIA